MDIVDPIRRSRMMAGVRSKNTKPELKVRRYLHAQGLRFRLHRKDLAGSPDLVLPRRRSAVFVHGCFWHGHNCPKARLPETRAEFWRSKIKANQERDLRVACRLRETGWLVEVVWECQITPQNLEALALRLLQRE